MIPAILECSPWKTGPPLSWLVPVYDIAERKLKFLGWAMAEQFDIAAWRHHRVGESLEAIGELDDAGYHFGVCGENAVKYALWASGVRAAWLSAGAATGKSPSQSLKGTPMRGHFPTLTSLVRKVQTEIAVHATGRHAGPIMATLLNPSFSSRFAGWDIDIRYADPHYTPVTPATCSSWHGDADDLVLAILV
jgi:hypothetical protein